MLLPDVAGDVPAEGRLVVTPAEACDWIAWGLESRHQTGADPILTTPDLTVTGFAGTSTTRSGSVSTNIFRGTLTTTPVAVCGTGNQPHVGVWRVYARYWATGLGVRFRLNWREGDGPFSANPYTAPVVEDGWCETDLGIVTIPPKLLGTQRWQGQVEAYTDTPGDTLDIDYLILLPIGEGFGKARKPPVFETPTTFSARDEFDQSAGNLSAKAAPVGGTWAGAGDADDFQVETTGKTAQRTAVSDTGSGRFATLDVNLAGVTAAVDFKVSGAAATQSGVLARYIDANNYAVALYTPFQLLLRKVVGGAITNLVSVNLLSSHPHDLFHSLRLHIDAAGRAVVWFFRQGASPGEPVLVAQHADFASGGALASGDVGILDYAPSSTAVTRNYDGFLTFVPRADAVCFANQSIEFRHDEVLREDSTGTYWGPPPEYRGAPFFIPPAGDEGRTSRVLVMVRKNDIETLPNASVNTSFSYQAFWTPQRILVPR